MGHDRRVIHQALHAAEALRQREHATGLEEAPRGLEPAADHEADDAAAARHLPSRERVLRMGIEPGIDHALDFRAPLQPARHGQPAGVVALHAQCQGLDAAQGEKAVEGPGHRADRVLQERELLGQSGIAHRNDHAAHHVRMAVQVLGGGVHHDVCAELQRPLAPGTGEGVVDHHQCTARPGLGRHGGNVDKLEHRVGRRLDPDHARVVLHGLGQRAGLRKVGIGDPQAGAARPHPVEQPAGAAVQVVHGDDVAAGVEHLEQRGDRSHAGGEGEAVAAALEVREAALPGHARGILGAGVLVALVHAGAGLGVGRSRVDRLHDRAGARVRGLAGVNDAGAEARAVFATAHLVPSGGGGGGNSARPSG
jgi:hypothetical protein